MNNEPPVASADFNHTTVSTTFRCDTAHASSRARTGSVLVKRPGLVRQRVGYPCRMLDAARAWMNAKCHPTAGGNRPFSFRAENVFCRHRCVLPSTAWPIGPLLPARPAMHHLAASTCKSSVVIERPPPGEH